MNTVESIKAKGVWIDLLRSIKSQRMQEWLRGLQNDHHGSLGTC